MHFHVLFAAIPIYWLANVTVLEATLVLSINKGGLHTREGIGYLDNWHTLLDPFLPPEAFGTTGDQVQQLDIFSQGITTQKFMPSTGVRIGNGQDIGTLFFTRCSHSDFESRVKVPVMCS